MHVSPSKPGFPVTRCAILGLTFCALAAMSAQAQSPLRRQPNAHEKQKLIEQIEADGLNCPVLGVVDNAGEDERGKMIRLHCSSLNGTASWDVRGIAAPNASALRFESWR